MTHALVARDHSERVDGELVRAFRTSVIEHPLLTVREREADMVHRLRDMGWQRTAGRLRQRRHIRLSRTYVDGDVTFSTSIDLDWLADVIRHEARELQCPTCHQLRSR